MRYKINGFLLSVDLADAVKNKEVITLTQQEQEALKLFFESQDGFVDTQTLESKVWGEQIVTSNSLRKLISGIRLKFGDKDSIKNIRGKGYQLSYEVLEKLGEDQISNRKVSLLTISFSLLFLVSVVVLFNSLFETTEPNLQPKVSRQTVFESQDNILDYAIYKGSMYVTAYGKKHSKLYKTTNRQNTVLMSADYSGAFRGIEIHSSGKTILHVVEDSKCKIKIYNKPVENKIDELPCNRQNAYPSFEWIDESRFYVTYNVELTASVEPYIYDLETKHLEKAEGTDFRSQSGGKFVDAFIKSYNGGMFSLREVDRLETMSLIYFKGDKQREIYKYRGSPYSVGLSKDKLYFLGNNNELLQIQLTEDVFSQNITPSIVLAPQTTKIDDPLVLENDLYFSLGNTSKRVIYSVSGDFNYSLENGVRDFTYNSKVLTVLASTNTGYAIEQLKDGNITNSIYLDTKVSLRQIAYYQENIYVAGAAGVYKLQDGELISISNLQAMELTSNGQCLLLESDGVYKFEGNKFTKIAAQGERVFQSENGCYYADKLTGNIYNQNKEPVSKQNQRKLLIEHQGKIAHKLHVGDSTHLIDVKSGEVIAKTPTRAILRRVVSYENDLLYLGLAAVNTSIVKLKFDQSN